MEDVIESASTWFITAALKSKISSVTGQASDVGRRTLCLYLIWNNRNMTPRINHLEYETSHDRVCVLYLS